MGETWETEEGIKFTFLDYNDSFSFLVYSKELEERGLGHSGGCYDDSQGHYFISKETFQITGEFVFDNLWLRAKRKIPKFRIEIID